MKKTPLTKMIEWVDEYVKNYDMMPTDFDVKQKANSLLKEEKKDIIDACNHNKGVNGWTNGEEYFTENFEQ
jgi:hypothetical protein